MKADFCSIETAIQTLRQGKMLLLVDDEKRENEGDLVIAAEHVDLKSMNFMIQRGSGIVCIALTETDFRRFNIPMMVADNQSLQKTPFGVSFEAATGISTGVSAADRTRAVHVICDHNSTASDIVMPGHLFPLCANEHGVIGRAGHTEGSVDLVRLAGLKSAAVICEVMNVDGSMARLPELLAFSQAHQIPVARINDLIRYRLQKECFVRQQSTTTIPIKQYGDFSFSVFSSCLDDTEQVVLSRSPISDCPLVRIHSECLTGDVFGSIRCDCGEQLDQSLNLISEQGGLLIYLKQEGRGIGLVNKIKAYALQDQGMDTVEANVHLGFSSDAREYGICAQILRHMNINQIRLLTNNPAKEKGLLDSGIQVVERVPLEIKPCDNNIHYLKTKRDKMGHLLTLGENS